MTFSVLVIIFAAGFLTLVAGLGATIFFRLRGGDSQITNVELMIGIPLSLVIVAAVGGIGYNIAFNNKITYHEYLNGWEIAARSQVINCDRDGSCKWTYKCDEHQCNPHKCNCKCTSRDKKGNCTSESCDTCYDTCYHACPYCNTETNFWVDTTLGKFDIAKNVLPANPQANRWVSIWSGDEYKYWNPTLNDVVPRAGTGIPAFWQQVADRIAAADPGPVSVRSDYNNFILASDSMFRAKSKEIEAYKKVGLLPDLEHSIAGFYTAHKVYFVGYKPDNLADWQDHADKLDAAIGNDLHGDLHIVIVQNDQISAEPAAYLIALKAYWQSDTFGKDAISKNGIIVVLGTQDGKKVSWGIATTGMPAGNVDMENAIFMRFGEGKVDLTPEAILGTVKGQVYTKTKSDGSTKLDVKAIHNNPPGALEDIIFGISKPETLFVRQSMSGKTGAGEGYGYQINDIQLDSGQSVGICLISFLVSCLVWVALALLPLGEIFNSFLSSRRSYRY